jgi:hypothetical protein
MLSALFPFELHNACQTSRDDRFVAIWRALALKSPADAAAVLPSLSRTKLAQLGLDDWLLIEPAALSLDEDRVRPAFLHAWVATHSGPAFLKAWVPLLRTDPERAAKALARHPNPGLEELAPEDLLPILESKRADIREIGIRLLGRSKAAPPQTEAPAVQPEARPRPNQRRI